MDHLIAVDLLSASQYVHRYEEDAVRLVATDQNPASKCPAHLCVECSAFGVGR
jgi:hypothetical protein